MVALRQVITVPLALCSLIAVFYSIGKLMAFLSLPSKVRIEFVWLLNLLDNWSRLEKALLPITIDTALIVLFILQHSLMRTEIVKAVWRKLGLETAERSIYNLATSATILVSALHSKFNIRQSNMNSLPFHCSFYWRNGNRLHHSFCGM